MQSTALIAWYNYYWFLHSRICNRLTADLKLWFRHGFYKLYEGAIQLYKHLVITLDAVSVGTKGTRVKVEQWM